MSSKYFAAVLWLLVALAVAACGGEQAAEPTAAPAAGEAGGGARVFVFSNSSPHVSVVDGGTLAVVETADIPDFTSWTWNDDNNFFDGENLWLGTKDPDTNEVAVILLNLETLEVTDRIPLGTDEVTLYIGKPSRDGTLFVSKHASGQVAAIDIASHEVLGITDIPVNGGVACDMDVAVGSDGVERVFVPTDNGDTVISLDPASLEVLETYTAPPDSRPFMLTAATSKDQVWVQERNTNANLVLDAITLEEIARVPAGEGVIVNAFSPDETLSYLGHTKDVVVTAVDTTSLQEVQRIQVGTNPQKVGVDPGGRYVYAILTQEGALAVIDTGTWQVTKRIPLGTNPSGIYVEDVNFPGN